MGKGYQLKTQKQVRDYFWQMHPYCDRQKITDDSGTGKTYKTDTRVAFVDFVDALARDGSISQELAQRVTLD